jgi:DNA-binding NtrC family response regulator
MFHSGENCLKLVDKNTRFAILISFKEPDKKDDMVKSIKLINPKTEVIILSYNDTIEKIIESFRAGAADYIIKDSNVKKNVIADIYWKISEPLRKMGREFGLPKYTGIFIATVVSMGVIVLIVLKTITH